MADPAVGRRPGGLPHKTAGETACPTKQQAEAHAAQNTVALKNGTESTAESSGSGFRAHSKFAIHA
jgi:hypothetical protein